MKIHYSNPHQLPLEAAGDAVFHADPAELLHISQFLSLNTPETPATHHFLNADTISLLPQGAIVVNTARGGLVKGQDVAVEDSPGPYVGRHALVRRGARRDRRGNQVLEESCRRGR